MPTNLENFIEAKKHHKNGNIEKAIKIYERLSKNINSDSKLFFYLGTAYLQIKRFKEALHSFEEAIRLDENVPDYYNNIGVTLSELNNDETAIDNYNKALKIKPNFVDPLINIGISYKKLRKFDLSKKYFEKSLKIFPNNPIVFNNLGNLLREDGNSSEAINCYDKAININKNYIEAINNKAEIFLLQRKFDEAIIEFRKVLKLNPKFVYSFGKLLHCKMTICDWTNFNQNIKIIEESINNNENIIEPFPLLSINDNPKLQKINAGLYNNYKFQNNLVKKSKKKFNKRNKIKVGYFGAEFYNHPVLKVTKDVFKNHNKSNFEIYGFSHGTVKDELTLEIEKHFNKFFDITRMSETEVTNLCNKIGIDIAVNLTGYTSESRNEIFFNRVAPIQISYLGYSGTMNANYMDYIIADNILITNKNYKNFSEQIINMPVSFFPNPSKFEISKKNITKEDVKLPTDKFIFGSFNNSYKITPIIFDAWMNILKKTDNSVLWLLNTHETAIKNLNKEAIKRGIEPERIIYADKLKYNEHLKRFQHMDLFLDTFPYNAHTTACEAMRCGVPIITLIGESFASRVAASLLNLIGMKNLICTDIDEYIKIAIFYRKNTNEFKKLKKDFSQNKINSFFNSKTYTKNLEKIYKELILK